MKKVTPGNRRFLLVLQVLIAGTAASASPQRMPLAFEKMADGRTYVLRGSQRRLALVAGGIQIEPATGNSAKIELRFGADTLAPTGEDKQPAEVHYYIGSDPKAWFTTSQYRQVRYRNAFPGIDLVFYPSEREIEYDWVVKPGADPSLVRFRFNSGTDVKFGPEGNLMLTLGVLRVVQRRPIAYQMIDGTRRAVNAGHRRLPDGQIGITVGEYDPKRELIVDPVLEWSSLIGGSYVESGGIIRAAPDGGAYLVFNSQSRYIMFPSTESSPHVFNTSSSYVFATGIVVKLSKSGQFAERIAYFGGSGETLVNDVKLDSAGNLYLAGSTYASDFPLKNAFRKQPQGKEGIIFKITDQFDLVYSSYIGGRGDDSILSVAVDPAGRAYLTGQTDSSDFININRDG